MDFVSAFKVSANRNRSWLVALSLAILTLFVFWPAVSFEFINLGDDTTVSANLHVLNGLSWLNVRWSFTALQAGFWRPFVWLSFLLDATLWGRAAAGFHLTNILLHTANTLLVYAFLKQITGSIWRSATVAALFALHPLQVETVAWIARRGMLLGTLFGLLSLWCYVSYARGKLRASNIQGLGFTLFFFVCALLASPGMAVLPVLMLLLDHWPLGRLTPDDWRLREKIPFFVCGFAITILALVNFSHHTAIAHPSGLRLENALVSYLRYLARIAWPFDLAPIYPYPVGYSVLEVVGSAFLVVVSAIWLWRSSPTFWRFGWYWYLALLLPMIGVFEVVQGSSADHCMYLPIVGIFFAVVWGAAACLERWQVPRLVVGWIILMALALLGWRASDQLAFWHDGGSLFAHAAAVTQGNYLAYALRGEYSADRQLYDLAEESFVKALEINPAYADAWNDLGLAVAAKSRAEEAMADYRHAIQIDPHHVEAWHNLGTALVGQRRYLEAINCYRRALELDPAHGQTFNSLGRLYASQRRFTDAVNCYIAAIKAQPAETGFRVNLAAALMAANRPQEGIAQYREALRENPNLTEVRNYLRAVDAKH